MRSVFTVVVAAFLGLGAYCCGPKPVPPKVAAPACVDADEICEEDEIGPYNCVCPG